MWKEPNKEYLHFVEAEVLTGNSTVGQRDLILPPLVGEDPLEMYDSVRGPEISVIFSGYQALPKYIITCKVWKVICFSFLFLCCCGTNTNVRILSFKLYLLSERDRWLHSVLKQYECREIKGVRYLFFLKLNIGQLQLDWEFCHYSSTYFIFLSLLYNHTIYAISITGTYYTSDDITFKLILPFYSTKTVVILYIAGEIIGWQLWVLHLGMVTNIWLYSECKMIIKQW